MKILDEAMDKGSAIITGDEAAKIEAAFGAVMTEAAHAEDCAKRGHVMAECTCFKAVVATALSDISDRLP